MFDLRRVGCEMGGTSSEFCPVATRVSIVCFTVAGRTVVFDLS